jgi:ABC-2 type transport system ATP-binding protein
VTAVIARTLRTRGRRIVALAVVLVVTATVLLVAWPRSTPAPVTEINETITAPGGAGVGGTVSLDAGMYLPARVPAPAVILAHGFGQSRASMDGQARQLAGDGYVVLAYSARGFGASTGQIGLDSLDYEVPDARAVVDWLAKRPEVVQDGPNDPRVGVTGGSYGGALSLMLAGTDPRVDAVVAIATWNDLTQSLFPNNGGPSNGAVAQRSETPAAIVDRGDGVFKRAWAATLMSSLLIGGSGAAEGGAGSPPASNSSAGPGCGRMMPALCRAYSAVAETGRLTSAMSSLLARSSPKAVVGSIKAPTLLVQGEQDTLFGLDQADANAKAIAAAGTPVAVSWYAGGHDGGAPDQSTEDRITGWLHHYLFRSGDVPSTAFRYTVMGPVSDTGRARNRILEVPGYPGLAIGKSGGAGSGVSDGPDGTGGSGGPDASSSGGSGSPDAPNQADLGAATTPRVPVRLNGPPQAVLNPPGGVPAAISSVPGAGVLFASAAGALSGAVPGQTAVFGSAPVTATTVVTGSPTITLSVARLAAPATTPASTPAPASDDGSAVLFVSLASTGGSPSSSSDSGPFGSESGDNSGDTSGDSSQQSSTGTSTDLGGAAAAALSGGTLAGSAVSAVRLGQLPTDGSAMDVTVDLPAVSFQLQAGESFEVRVGTTDQAYAGPTAPAVYRIALSGSPVLSVPEVGGVRVSAGEEPIGVLIGLVVLVVGAIVALILAGRVRVRRTGTSAGPNSGDPPVAGEVNPVAGAAPATALAAESRSGTTVSATDELSPLSISGLRKAYPGGVVAVDDVTFEVRRGQVLGLLGPNGAGKTTTLRMVMGLITPTAGRITVFGSDVRSGADVLSRIGSFVEGSGFLPHLSGRTNLELYWRATSRPAADAHFDEALQIADLGTAVNRRVKTYSHGMRQRLAIAQAMLGLPDLLLLDEPTNGLDPPQIHAMREVLRRYADTGRTVVISSHLLSEVEQTCSHVVIINKGRTIAAGSVREMVSESGEMVFGVSDAAAAGRAIAVLAGLGGVGETTAVPGGVQADLGDLRPAGALRALLDAGIEITSAAPSNRLEDVFLALVGGQAEDTRTGAAGR